MKITVSKEEFEYFIPVAKSAHDAVYNSVVPHLQEYADETAELYLGDVGVKAANEDAVIMMALKKYVSIVTFLLMMEQKDVVLTPTGFGVVSNDQVAPASSSRVNAVHQALQRDSLIAFSRLIKMLTKVDGWGEQEEAAFAISLPIWSMRQMMQVYGNKLSVETFHSNIATERRAMQKVREWIGDETVDYCLMNLRCNRRDEYTKLIELFEQIVIAFIDGDIPMQQELYRKLLLKLERNIETYTLYAESDEYKANIAERYENKKEDSAFFFG